MRHRATRFEGPGRVTPGAVPRAAERPATSHRGAAFDACRISTPVVTGPPTSNYTPGINPGGAERPFGVREALPCDRVPQVAHGGWPSRDCRATAGTSFRDPYHAH